MEYFEGYVVVDGTNRNGHHIISVIASLKVGCSRISGRRFLILLGSLVNQSQSLNIKI